MSSGPTQALWSVRREVLVPISLDIDIDGVRVVDTLAWDRHQSEVRYIQQISFQCHMYVHLEPASPVELLLLWLFSH